MLLLKVKVLNSLQGRAFGFSPALYNLFHQYKCNRHVRSNRHLHELRLLVRKQVMMCCNSHHLPAMLLPLPLMNRIIVVVIRNTPLIITRVCCYIAMSKSCILPHITPRLLKYQREIPKEIFNPLARLGSIAHVPKYIRL